MMIMMTSDCAEGKYTAETSQENLVFDLCEEDTHNQNIQRRKSMK